MTKKHRNKLSVLLSCMLVCGSMFGCSVQNQTSSRLRTQNKQVTVKSIVGTDVYGRTIDEIVETDDEKQVGMFYFLWLNYDNAVMDISKLMERYGNTMDNPLWDPKSNAVTDLESPFGAFHHWGEPLYGYYNSSDPWVIRRHLELFTASGLDFLAIDATNDNFYLPALTVLMGEITNLIEQGFEPPRVCLYTNSNAINTVYRAYEQIYKANVYPKAWYTVNGKPVIIGATTGDSSITNLNQEVKDFFHLVPGQWPNEELLPDSWPWISWEYPQYNHNGSVNVSVSQHVNGSFSRAVHPETLPFYNAQWGRGFSHRTGGNSKEGTREGTNLSEQWETVLTDKDSVDRVFVTGWNEWVAQKLLESSTEVKFVDTVTEEFSRDLEMMKGGYGDTYYLLNSKFMRDFKATKFGKNYVQQATVDIFDRAAVWGGKTYYDMTGDCSKRDYQGSSKYIIDYSSGKAEKVVLPNYVDNTNRNDIKSVTVASDSDYLYFKIETLRTLDVVYNDPTGGCLNVFLNFEGKSGEAWEGYQYKLNHDILSKTKTTLHKATGNGYEWEKVAEVDCNIYGNVMTIKVPLSSLNISQEFTLDFKVTDNISDPEDIMSYYIYGDSAPIGRLNYRYNVKK